ncbi:hypothetical protein ALC57_15616 [Trachymyrmex cornetzi]|uniref:Uncharacterized protein n=1 Tax=Trachymyrmex cornetzi TaxID=471704 RepID=A0A151IWL3_9HYME|nr:hypothetical protein ALC57_15616 [Trachymyrmex cornetzi]
MEKIAQKHDVIPAIEFFLQSLELIRRELLYAGLISSTMHRGISTNSRDLNIEYLSASKH